MLASARLQTIICTSRMQQAERFYGEVLALPMKRRSHGGVIYDVGGGDLLVAPVRDWQPSGHTAVGFSVADLDQTMKALSERGLRFERIAQLPQNDAGVLLTPWGARVAWIRDPDGNFLSIVQYA